MTWITQAAAICSLLLHARAYVVPSKKQSLMDSFSSAIGMGHGGLTFFWTAEVSKVLYLLPRSPLFMIKCNALYSVECVVYFSSGPVKCHQMCMMYGRIITDTD